MTSNALSHDMQQSQVNVGDIERWVSAAVGGAFTIYGLSRLSLPGAAMAAVGGCLLYRGITGHCNVYGAMGLDTSNEKSPHTSIPSGRGMRIEKSVTVRRPASELFRYWRRLENLPHIMRHLESVKAEGARTHWKAKGPLGVAAEWDAIIINERPNELIAWRSVDDSMVDTAGSVHFRDLGNGNTEVHVNLKYDPPAGRVGAAIANWLGENPEHEIEEDLQEFKRTMEAGQSTRTPGQPIGAPM